MKEFFLDLFAYHHHYNQKLAEQLTSYEGKTGEKILFLFSHIVNAHRIWNARILEEHPGTGVNDVRPISENMEQDLANYTDSCRIVSGFPLEERVHYRTTRGDSFSNTLTEILFHIVNHTTHHRAQIMFDLRQHGIEPMMTDYIFYKR